MVRLHVDPNITTSLLFFLILDATSKVRFVLDQHAELDFYSANSLKQKSAGRHVAPLRHIILIQSRPAFVLSP